MCSVFEVRLRLVQRLLDEALKKPPARGLEEKSRGLPGLNSIREEALSVQGRDFGHELLGYGNPARLAFRA